MMIIYIFYVVQIVGLIIPMYMIFIYLTLKCTHIGNTFDEIEDPVNNGR